MDEATVALKNALAPLIESQQDCPLPPLFQDSLESIQAAITQHLYHGDAAHTRAAIRLLRRLGGAAAPFLLAELRKSLDETPIEEVRVMQVIEALGAVNIAASNTLLVEIGQRLVCAALESDLLGRKMLLHSLRAAGRLKDASSLALLKAAACSLSGESFTPARYALEQLQGFPPQEGLAALREVREEVVRRRATEPDVLLPALKALDRAERILLVALHLRPDISLMGDVKIALYRQGENYVVVTRLGHKFLVQPENAQPANGGWWQNHFEETLRADAHTDGSLGERLHRLEDAPPEARDVIASMAWYFWQHTAKDWF